MAIIDVGIGAAITRFKQIHGGNGTENWRRIPVGSQVETSINVAFRTERNDDDLLIGHFIAVELVDLGTVPSQIDDTWIDPQNTKWSTKETGRIQGSGVQIELRSARTQHGA